MIQIWDTKLIFVSVVVYTYERIKLAGLTIAASLLLAACGTEEETIEQDAKKEEQKEKVKAFQEEKQWVK
ncbi:DUF874 family protein [Bacillus wiedmannii]|nr:DUF874 family protein [Bacillus sp. BPN334]MCR6850031.1 DUF874 family protein [Bacillus sp. IBL03825]MCU5110861.1 DUF874 family protein [Bacillus wiedmannii]MCU5150388.1 DUF874 family protein [Bacillus wiedmannii]MCU5410744.1 DUF874 family protein [Bacillus wiedmannii]MED3613956.1 DUF874 family protein [Bacillus wiedmannii]